tara:strand:+ start:896 stop:1531 length:636 start_codon:yes stop_codon:yes gene_type:complete
MKVVGNLGKNPVRVRNIFQDRINRFFFGFNCITPCAGSQGVNRQHRTFSLSELWCGIVRHTIKIGVLRGFKLCTGQHLRALTEPYVKSDDIFMQSDDRVRLELVAPTVGIVRNRQIDKRSGFARIICPVIASKRGLSHLISEVNTLFCVKQKLMRAKYFLEPDTIAVKYHVWLGDKKSHSVSIKKIDWIKGAIAKSNLESAHGIKILEMPV